MPHKVTGQLHLVSGAQIDSILWYRPGGYVCYRTMPDEEGKARIGVCSIHSLRGSISEVIMLAPWHTDFV